MHEAASELRSVERYIVDTPFSGSFGAASVCVLNIAIRGVFIEHAHPLRIRTAARLWFKRDDVTISVQGMVVWSHLSKTANDKGKLLYNSGILIEETAAFSAAIETLLRRGLIRRDTESLERKRQRLARNDKSSAR